MASEPSIILASRSAQRNRLLTQLGVPFTTSPAHVDETPLKGEAPLAYIKRIAYAKASKVSAENPGSIVVAADTPIILGRRILQQPESREDAIAMLRLQSGHRIHIPTVVVVADAEGKLRHKTVDSWMKLKHLANAEIDAYLNRTFELWPKVAGAILIEEMEPWITQMHGSISGIFGLPLYETALLLKAAGVKLP